MGAHISKLVVCSALLTYGVTPGVMAKGSTGTGRLARYLTDAGSFPSIRQGVESHRPIRRPLAYDGPKNFPRRNNIRGRLLRVQNIRRPRTPWPGFPVDSDTSNGPESAANGLSSDSGNDMDSTLYDVNGPLNYVGPKKFPRRKLRARVKKDNRSPEFDELVGRISPPTRFSRRLGNMGHLRRRPNIGCTWRCVGGKYCKKVCPSSTPSSHYTHCVQQNEINCEGTGVCNVVTVQICD